MSSGKMVIVVPKDSHLADCVQKIMDGKVDEKTLRFSEQYGGPWQTLGERTHNNDK